MTPENEEVDGCGLDFREDALTERDAELFVLFAEALDELTTVTVEDTATAWKALFP